MAAEESAGPLVNGASMFLTDDELGSFVQDQLNQVGGTALEDFQVSVVSQGNLAAYWEIVDAFVHRGYTQARVDLWDRGAEFERAIGCWFYFAEFARRQPDVYSEAFSKMLDRRVELRLRKENGVLVQPVALTVNGCYQQPTTKVGQPVIGRRSGWRQDVLGDWPARL